MEKSRKQNTIKLSFDPVFLGLLSSYISGLGSIVWWPVIYILTAEGYEQKMMLGNKMSHLIRDIRISSSFQ
jgi:hypothetical protein